MTRHAGMVPNGRDSGKCSLRWGAMECDLALSGWVRDHPLDGRELAHLLLYPISPGHEEQLDRLGKSLGLAIPSSRMTDVDREQASAQLTLDGRVHLLIGQLREFTAMPTVGWIEAASRRGHVMLTLGQQAWNGDDLLLGAYLADSAFLRMGLVGIERAIEKS